MNFDERFSCLEDDNQAPVFENLEITLKKMQSLKDVIELIDEAIIHWRQKDEEYSKYYVNAYQSMRKIITGEVLEE